MEPEKLHMGWRLAFSAAVVFGSYGIGYWMLGEVGGLILFVCAFPAAALVMSRPLLELVLKTFLGIRGLAYRHALEEWQGRYYRYGTRHIRLFVDRIERPWFVADDVLSVIEKKKGDWLPRQFNEAELGTIPGRSELGFSRQGVTKLLSLSAHPEAKKFMIWIERDVFFPMDRRKESAAAQREGDASRRGES